MSKSISRLLTLLFIALLTFSVTITATSAQKAPEFSLKTDSGTITLNDLKGKVVYLDFWASWCVPCRKSFPWMNAMHVKYSSKGLVILAINLDKKPEAVAKFLKQYPAKFKIAYDPSGKSAEAYKVLGMPSSYILDRNGNIVSTHIGFREKDKAELEKKINEVLLN
ncbi:MAG: TlpA family protein disulfide reductase [Gammaproteobacteria bacterium]